MFYGDETLRDLILHSKDLIKYFDEFKIDYEIFNGSVNEEIFLKERQQEEEEKMFNEQKNKENEDNP